LFEESECTYRLQSLLPVLEGRIEKNDDLRFPEKEVRCPT
jgi:hypothetical protein